MPDFRSQLRQHYDSQALPTGKVDAILARGKVVPAGGQVTAFPERAQSPWRQALPIAAVITLFAALAIWFVPHGPEPLPFAEIAPHVIEFFSSKPQMTSAPQDKAEIRSWQIAQGAPPEFHIPASLMGLESEACHVVDVHGRKLYLSCFWMENGPEKGGRELVHLLVARRGDFRDAPSSTKAEIQELDGWSFASWTEGDVLYTIATAAPAARLRPLLAVQAQRRVFATTNGRNQGPASFVAWINR
jgi:hypothetical protein